MGPSKVHVSFQPFIANLFLELSCIPNFSWKLSIINGIRTLHIIDTQIFDRCFKIANPEFPCRQEVRIERYKTMRKYRGMQDKGVRGGGGVGAV